MARGETQITWSAANSITLSSATAQVSDEFLFNDGDINAAITVNADNAGTPTSGDIVNIRIQWTTGDVLGDSGNDFDTTEHAEVLGVLDTFGTNTPGEDPARRTYHIPVGARGFRLAVDAPLAATRNIVVRARIAWQRF